MASKIPRPVERKIVATPIGRSVTSEFKLAKANEILRATLKRISLPSLHTEKFFEILTPEQKIKFAVAIDTARQLGLKDSVVEHKIVGKKNLIEFIEVYSDPTTRTKGKGIFPDPKLIELTKQKIRTDLERLGFTTQQIAIILSKATRSDLHALIILGESKSDPKKTKQQIIDGLGLERIFRRLK